MVTEGQPQGTGSPGPATQRAKHWIRKYSMVLAGVALAAGTSAGTAFALNGSGQRPQAQIVMPASETVPASDASTTTEAETDEATTTAVGETTTTEAAEETTTTAVGETTTTEAAEETTTTAVGETTTTEAAEETTTTAAPETTTTEASEETATTVAPSIRGSNGCRPPWVTTGRGPGDHPKNPNSHGRQPQCRWGRTG